MQSELKPRLVSIVFHNHPLINHNTFGINITTSLFSQPANGDELAALMGEYDHHKHPFLVIGEGSNILFTQDFPGLVLNPAMKGIQVVEENKDQVVVRVGAAVNWDNWVAHANEKGWYGLENLSLIPGSVGSSPVQNIGAYGTELKDHFAWLEAWDLEQSKSVRINPETCRFGYRNSIFKTEDRGRYVITHVAFNLVKEPIMNLSYGNLATALEEAGGTSPKDLRNVIIAIRNQKLPDHEKTGNAGSFFKNPLVAHAVFRCLRVDYPDIPHYPEAQNLVKIPAAWLIEKAGWKGKRIGNVGTWPAQPLVIVNHGGASGQEILDFSEQICQDVDEKFRVTLEREVNVI